jgi:hypothetical protein
MNALRLTRNRLEHWIHMPFFRDAVKGGRVIKPFFIDNSSETKL